MLKLHRYSSWLYYMGFIYLTGALVCIVSRSCELFLVWQYHEIARGNNEKIKDLDEAFKQVYQDFVTERKEKSMFNQLFEDVEDKRAVLMGNGGTLKVVLVINIITGCLFFMQGFYMYSVVGTTKKTVETIEEKPFEECA